MRSISSSILCLLVLTIGSPARCGDDGVVTAQTTVVIKPAAPVKTDKPVAAATATPVVSVTPIATTNSSSSSGSAGPKPLDAVHRNAKDLELDNLLRPIWGFSPPGQ